MALFRLNNPFQPAISIQGINNEKYDLENSNTAGSVICILQKILVSIVDIDYQTKILVSIVDIDYQTKIFPKKFGIDSGYQYWM